MSSKVDPNATKILANQSERNRRKSLLFEPHVAPLTAFVQRLREEGDVTRRIPYIDPLDGGVAARVLFVLEAPGPKAVGSGFISRDNPDETAKNLLLACKAADLDRRDTVLWNIVPWYIGDGNKIRAASEKDIDEGLPCLDRLIVLLPQLQSVVLVGSKAQRADGRLRENCHGLRIFHCPHPSPMFVNRRPGNRARLVAALNGVARGLNRSGA